MKATSLNGTPTDDELTGGYAPPEDSSTRAGTERPEKRVQFMLDEELHDELQRHRDNTGRTWAECGQKMVELFLASPLGVPKPPVGEELVVKQVAWAMEYAADHPDSTPAEAVRRGGGSLLGFATALLQGDIDLVDPRE